MESADWEQKLVLTPTKAQRMAYWLLVIAARAVLDMWILPLRVRQSLIMLLTNASSYCMGRTTLMDEYVGCDHLARAIEVDDIRQVYHLIRKYPSIMNKPWLGSTPLELAVSCCAVSSTELLLKYCDVNPTDLLKCCQHIEIYRKLVSKGADPSKRDKDGRICVDVVALNEHIEIAEEMIRQGARASSTCLRTLIMRGQDDAAERLAQLMDEVSFEQRKFVNLVLFRSCYKLVTIELVRDLIMEYLDL